MNAQRSDRRSRRPFSLQISLYLDTLTIQLEALRPGPRREAILHERTRVERRFVDLKQVTL